MLIISEHLCNIIKHDFKNPLTSIILKTYNITTFLQLKSCIFTHSVLWEPVDRFNKKAFYLLIRILKLNFHLLVFIFIQMLNVWTQVSKPWVTWE